MGASGATDQCAVAPPVGPVGMIVVRVVDRSSIPLVGMPIREKEVDLVTVLRGDQIRGPRLLLKESSGLAPGLSAVLRGDEARTAAVTRPTCDGAILPPEGSVWKRVEIHIRISRLVRLGPRATRDLCVQTSSKSGEVSILALGDPLLLIEGDLPSPRGDILRIGGDPAPASIPTVLSVYSHDPSVEPKGDCRIVVVVPPAAVGTRFVTAKLEVLPLVVVMIIGADPPPLVRSVICYVGAVVLTYLADRPGSGPDGPYALFPKHLLVHHPLVGELRHTIFGCEKDVLAVAPGMTNEVRVILQSHQ